MYARFKGMRAIAITDHDTVSGNEEALLEGRRQGVEVIPGVELSVSVPKGELHLLGYYMSHSDRGLQAAMREFREHRRQRNPLIIQKLREMGIDLDLEEIRRRVPNGNVGRPHIAAFMVEKGFVPSIKEAFDRFLRRDGPAYVPKEHLSPEEGVRFIRRFGGLPVVAHPCTIDMDDYDLLVSFLGRLKDVGLAGVEVYHSSHTYKRVRLYEGVCKRLELVKTGGSDFHGQEKPHIEIGLGRNGRRVPYSVVEDLRQALPEGHPDRSPSSRPLPLWAHV